MKYRISFRGSIIILFIVLYLPSLLLLNSYFVKKNSEINKVLQNIKLSESLSNLEFKTGEDSLKAKNLLNQFNENMAARSFIQHESQIYSAVFLFVLMLLSIFIFILIFYRISNPLKKLQNATSKIAKGDFSLHLEETGIKEIKQLTQSFNSMSRELDSTQKKLLQAEKDTMWKELSRILAHEIKNPLTPIQLSIQRLEEKYEIDPEKFYEVFPETVNIINHEVNNLKLLVSSFSNFAKNINPEFSEFNPRTMIDDILNSYQHNFEIKTSGENCTILFDRTHFYQIITNLVQNAIDASEKEDNILIEITKSNSNIIVSISDSGKGINKKDINKIFEPYFTKKKKGTGLGLALVKKLVDVNNANINVTSKEKEGSCFEIVIPNRSVLNQGK